MAIAPEAITMSRTVKGHMSVVGVVGVVVGVVMGVVMGVVVGVVAGVVVGVAIRVRAGNWLTSRCRSVGSLYASSRVDGV